jgi:hypothetical protein
LAFTLWQILNRLLLVCHAVDLFWEENSIVRKEAEIICKQISPTSSLHFLNSFHVNSVLLAPPRFLFTVLLTEPERHETKGLTGLRSNQTKLEKGSLNHCTTP